MDESSFTGEAKPARKDASVVCESNVTSKPNCLYMGTLVRYGNGRVRHDTMEAGPVWERYSDGAPRSVEYPSTYQ